MGKIITDQSLTFVPIGQFGIEAAVHEGFAYVRMPMDPALGKLSASGKTKMTASSGGWAGIPGTDFRINLNGGVRV